MSLSFPRPRDKLRHWCGKEMRLLLKLPLSPASSGPLSMKRTERQNSQRKKKCFYLSAAVAISDLFHSSHPNATPLGRQLMILQKALLGACLLHGHFSQEISSSGPFPISLSPYPDIIHPTELLRSLLLVSHRLEWGFFTIIQVFRGVHLIYKRLICFFSCQIMECVLFPNCSFSLP